MRNKFLSLGLLVLVGVLSTALSAQVTTTTTFVGGNNHRGNMFDLTVGANQIAIYGLDTNPVAAASTALTIEVYYRTGTYVGNETASTGWTLHESVNVICAGSGNATPTIFASPLILASSTTYGIYVTSTNTSISLNYTNGTGVPGNQQVIDTHIQLDLGAGMEYPFTNGSSPFTPRVWNGNIHYVPGDPGILLRRNALPAFGTDDVGAIRAGVAKSLTYTIDNTGTASALTITTPLVAPSNLVNCTATITTQPTATVAASTATTVVVEVTPTAAGAFSCDLSMTSNAQFQATLNWTISGVGGDPEIDIQRPAATSIASGATDAIATSFVSTAIPLTYTLDNSAGTAELTLSGTPNLIAQSNAINCAAVIVDPTTNPVLAGGTDTFTITVTPTAVGVWSVDISIDNDDATENPYTFTISGTAATNATPVIAVTESGNAVVADQVLNVAASSTVTALTLVLGATDANIGDTITLTSVVTSTGSITGFAQAEWDDAGSNPATTSPATGTFSATGVLHTVVITAVDNNAASSTFRFFILVAGGTGAAPTAALTGTSSMTGNSTAGFALSVEINTALALADLELADGDSDPVDILSVTGSGATGVTAPSVATGLAVPATISWTGTPTVAGTYVYTVAYTDNNTAPQSFTVTITVTDPSTGVGGGSGGGGGSGCAAGTSGSNVWFAVLGLLGLVAVIRLRREVA